MSSIWGEPDGCAPMKFSNHPFVEPASFAPSLPLQLNAQWRYDEDSKEGLVDSNSNSSLSDNVAAANTSQDGEDEFGDDDYGELEIIVRFRRRTGRPTSSTRKLKLTSEQNLSAPPAADRQMNPSPSASHRVYKPQSNQRLCIVDNDSSCACSEFHPSILRDLLAQTLGKAGLALDPSFNDGFPAVQTADSHGDQKVHQLSGSSGKKRLLSNASEDASQTQPNKKQPRLSRAENADLQESNEGEDGTERHTCPYFKMAPEKYLECGTKDLAQRPKIKSHVIKDHLRKEGRAIPPEIRSQKCEPWERWCKWIVQGTPKADRPVPNSTPDFYPVLNYVVTAASEIPSDGLTGFSSVMLRLFKSIHANPGDWTPFIGGLESLEQSLNSNPGLPTMGPETSSRRLSYKAEDNVASEDEEPSCQRDEPEAEFSTSLPGLGNDIALSRYSIPATVTAPEDLPLPSPAYSLNTHPSYNDIPEPSPPISAGFPHSHDHLDPNIFTHPTGYMDMSWISGYNLLHDPTLSQGRQLDHGYYNPVEACEKPVGLTNHYSVPSGIGTNSKSLVRAAQQPRVRKRKTGAVRPHHVEGAPLRENTSPTQKLQIIVNSQNQEEIFEYYEPFSASNFLEWLRVKFTFSLDPTDNRKLWCVDSREDIHMLTADSIKAHLKSWSARGNTSKSPSFRIGTHSLRTLGVERWSGITAEFVDGVVQNSIDDVSLILSSVRPNNRTVYH